jgi:hypothetical protein
MTIPGAGDSYWLPPVLFETAGRKPYYFTLIVIVRAGSVSSNFAFFHSGGPILAA